MNIDKSSVELDGVYYDDYPDFADAFVSYAEKLDGTPLTDEELEELNGDSETVHSLVMDYLH